MSSLHYLQLSGSHHELGVQLGQFGATAFHKHLLPSSAWAELSQWRGSEAIKTIQNLVQNHFPQIAQEIEGLAEGLAIPLEDAYIWNSRGDLWAMAPDSCSSVLQTQPVPRITHNEDGDPGFYGHCGVIEFAPTAGTRFTSFVYPGSIAGHTFAANEHQLCMSVNNIRALFARPGMPRMVLCRAILNCKTVAEAVALLRAHNRSGAFNLNLGDVSGAIHSVEFNEANVSDLPIAAPYFHANHAVHDAMRNYPQIITGSSGYRQIQGDDLVKNHNTVDALAILGDSAHNRFPIYRRDAADTDNENTIATADFIYGAAGLEWHVYDGPQTQPLFSFQGLTRI
ncbi:C45 family autoproteolytic acyltransferase/hydrolase [Paenalcaligenes hominis]|uniref:C45 family autoproteolytic acyltransferase/hydolase n=1 Tax=Paenalcaligenes hominis TaxID=643674 RepID=UPI003524AAD7